MQVSISSGFDVTPSSEGWSAFLAVPYFILLYEFILNLVYIIAVLRPFLKIVLIKPH